MANSNGLHEEPDEILEGLYLGGEWSAKNLRNLKQLKITHILTVASNIPPPFLDTFKYKILPVFDMENVDLLIHFNSCHEFIDGALAEGGAILVHCHAGASRSATIVISYLMKTLGLGWEQATDFAVARRPVVCPNFGFLRQLQRYEELLKNGIPIPYATPSRDHSFTSGVNAILYWYSTSNIKRDKNNHVALE